MDGRRVIHLFLDRPRMNVALKQSLAEKYCRQAAHFLTDVVVSLMTFGGPGWTAEAAPLPLAAGCVAWQEGWWLACPDRHANLSFGSCLGEQLKKLGHF